MSQEMALQLQARQEARLLAARERAPYATLVPLIVLSLREHSLTRWSEEGVDVLNTYGIDRRNAPMVPHVCKAVAGKLLELLHAKPSVQDLDAQATALLDDKIPDVLSSSHPTDHIELKDPVAIRMLQMYQELYPPPSPSALRMVENAEFRHISFRDIPAIKALYDERKLKEPQQYLLATGDVDELQQYFKAGGFWADFEKNEQPSLERLLANSMNIQRYAGRPEIQYAKETITGCVMTIDNAVRGVGWYRNPPINTLSNRAYREAMAEIVNTWPTVTKQTDDRMKKRAAKSIWGSFEKGVSHLEMIQSNIPYGALEIMTKLHEGLRDFMDQTRIKLELLLSYYSHNATVLRNRRPLELPTVAVRNAGSANLLNNHCGLEDLGVVPADLMGDPNLEFSLDPSDPELSELKGLYHVYVDWMRVSGKPRRVFEITEKKNRKLKKEALRD